MDATASRTEETSEDFLTVKELAGLLGVDRQTIRARITSGELSAINVGTDKWPRYRVSRADYDCWLERRRVGREGA